MQDKEFDQLFKDRFEEAEIMPSSASWDAIQAEITPVRKRAKSVWWVAAAIVLVALSAGLFFNTSDKIQLQGKSSLVKISEATPALSQPSAQGQDPIRLRQSAPIKSIASAQVVDYHLKHNVLQASEEKSLGTVQPNAALAHPIHIENETLAKVSVGAIQETTVADVALASADVPSTTMDAVVNENDQAEHTRIRNMGDLINFVVDKVDKREQKFLQFKTDDDDNSSLVAINIGPFKLNPRKHK